MIAQLSKEYIFTKPSKIIPRLISYFFFEGRPATTKGQWFNRYTFKSLQKASATPAIEASESPIFITGTGRTGSTILGLILSMHRDVGFLNEPKAMWYFVNPSDDLIGSYSKDEADYFMNKSHNANNVSGKVKSIYSHFLNKSSSKRIIDKYPEMIFRVEFLNSVFNQPRYIFLVRNPWDTIASTVSWSDVHENTSDKTNWWGVNNRKWKLLVEQVVAKDPNLSIHQANISKLQSQSDMAAVEWIVTMNIGLQMIEKFPDKIIKVKYEELCAQPEQILNRILKFNELQTDQTCIDFGKKILSASPPKSKITLQPELEAAIHALCLKLGY